jgi:hypothetical protein
MEKQPKIYVPGSAKAKQFDWGQVLNISFKADKIIEFIEQHKNDKGYINLKISPRKEVGQYGDTHTMEVDTWSPKQAGSAPSTRPPQPGFKSPPDGPGDAVPF